MSHGTIFECDGSDTAIRHKVPQASDYTACGKYMVFEGTPEFCVEHELPKEERCKKCYTDFRRRKKK